MTTRSTFRSAVAAAAIAATLAGCASSGTRVETGFGGKADGNVGLATHALAALAANNSAEAITYAERAVEQTPDDAGFRSLLGNAYFAGGRFWSAESAYKDALSIYSNQPQTILKLALVEIALGKPNEAISFLNAGKSVLDTSNYGLALALAGQPDEAVRLLESAARAKGADAQLRQNLALAYALSGNWTQARVIASQDVPASQLDSRLHQWAQLAHPAKAGDQVAALVGVTPAVTDQGQPVRLALRRDAGAQMAAAAPVQPQVAAPAPVEVAPAAPVMVAAAAPIAAPLPQPKYVEPTVAPPPPTAPVVEQAAAVAPAPPPVDAARIAAMAPEAPAAFLAATFASPVHKIAKPKPVVAAAAPRRRAPVLHAALKRSHVNAVVQLGAFSSADRVQVAWDKAARRYAMLRAYAPMSARYSGAKGIFYRLSVKGFANQAEAANLCSALKRSGRACFVRTFAGDRPMEIASR